jgi:hypothetical protein
MINIQKNITDANQVLTQYRYENPNRGSRGNNSASKKDTEQEIGSEEKLELSFLQMEGLCYCCGKRIKSPTCANLAKHQKRSGTSTR